MGDAIDNSETTAMDSDTDLEMHPDTLPRTDQEANDGSLGMCDIDVHAPLPVDKVIEESGPNDFSKSKLLQSQDDIGIQLLCNAAADHDLDVRYHRNLIFEVFDERRRVVFRQNSPENSAVYSYCARKKHIAKQMLAEQGIPVPSGNIFREYESALRFFIQSGAVVTVKPADGNAGHGVTSGVSSEAEFSDAWEFAKKESRDIIVEQNIFGEDIRIIVVGGKAEAAYVRIPASVTGDGVHSVRELVAQKNAIRRLNPGLRIDPIKRFDLLERDGISLDYIPEPGDTLQLTSVANASAGGETVQVFDYLDQEILELAERGAKCFPGLVQVGVDLIYTSPDQWQPGLPRGYIIEVNSNPGICDTVFPSYGRSIDVPGKLVSHMFSDAGAQFSRKLPKSTVSLAEPYRYERFGRVFGKGNTRQAALIKQAAYALNLEVKQVAGELFRLTGDNGSCLFHNGMPDRVRMITRKVTRNREWMSTVLPKNSEYAAGQDTQLNRFRLFVVGGKLVSALHVYTSGDRGGLLRREVGDLVHPSIQTVLDKTLSAIFDPMSVGIEFWVGDISSDLSQQPWEVRDAVCNPNLFWHHFPSEGGGRDVAKALVSSVFDEVDFTDIPRVCARFVIRGHVQGVGFRRWLKLISILHSTTGWVRNNQEGDESVVEAVLEGTPSAINRLYTLCHSGPKSAQVDSVDRSELPCSGKSQFSVIS
ncbi:hypothetical protein Mag101_05560 [Microbulbifer agarilyticus]|uniref:acylphosphatase n=1 Tax=Microbulbifer agarilyticus TaxID=260552 RepID=A0A1Q2M3B1_9GAMM|nr:acylphosphatase [Microbulbifer agarilyticus]AQQ67160.1 hypothetical protein Mag101_05560 [Microbulbifer agarilyticus]